MRVCCDSGHVAPVCIRERKHHKRILMITPRVHKNSAACPFIMKHIQGGGETRPPVCRYMQRAVHAQNNHQRWCASQSARCTWGCLRLTEREKNGNKPQTLLLDWGYSAVACTRRNSCASHQSWRLNSTMRVRDVYTQMMQCLFTFSVANRAGKNVAERYNVIYSSAFWIK